MWLLIIEYQVLNPPSIKHTFWKSYVYSYIDINVPPWDTTVLLAICTSHHIILQIGHIQIYIQSSSCFIHIWLIQDKTLNQLGFILYRETKLKFKRSTFEYIRVVTTRLVELTRLDWISLFLVKYIFARIQSAKSNMSYSIIFKFNAYEMCFFIKYLVTLSNQFDHFVAVLRCNIS